MIDKLAFPKQPRDHGPLKQGVRLQLRRCRAVRLCATVDIVCDGGATSASGRVRYGHCLGVPHASAQPSAATASAIISSGRDGSVASAAASSVQPSAASSAGARRSRASITATTTSSRCTRAPRHRLRPVLRPCARARSGVHMQAGLSAWRCVRGLDSILAQCSPLRGYSTHTQRCGALVRQRLGGVGGGAPAYAQRVRRRTPAQQSTKRPWQRWLRVRMWVGVSPVLAQRWAA